MSCNGCRVLRKGCSDGCVLRPCLQWIDTADAQGHATVFVAKFFGRAGLLSFISAVPEEQRPALFQSLLYEAAGRTINPVHGAVGLLWTGNWPLCQAAVETVLRGGAIGPLPELGGACGGAGGDLYGAAKRNGGWSTFSTAKRVRTKAEVPAAPSCDLGLCLSPGSPPTVGERRPALRLGTPSMSSDESVTTTGGERDPMLLNLFV
uniref:LOB domain-containing protein n=1 Tax=Oryza punctata TaxID=4537 RepID=A0A0E0KFH3_ORYPU